MNETNIDDTGLTDVGSSEQEVEQYMSGYPQLFQMLVENSLVVADSLRDNYYKNTARFVAVIKRNAKSSNPVLVVHQVQNANWESVQNEVVTSIDGGIGRAQIANQAPFLLRVGSYCVRTGERVLSEREKFGHYPIILGDLEGGSKERDDFPDIVRITAELIGGLAALERTPDLRVLLFHGPLVYTVPRYMGHTPFVEKDIDRFLRHYASDPQTATDLKEEFLQIAEVDIYPAMTPNSALWIKQRVFEPLAWMAFLYRKLIETARQRNPVPIIVGVVERGRLREFSETVLLKELFRRLRKNGQSDYFNQMFGRSDLVNETALMNALQYTDDILLSMLLEPEQCTQAWNINKYAGFSYSDLSLPNTPGKERVNFNPLCRTDIGFPTVSACYLKVSDKSLPIRIECFEALGDQQLPEAARRVLLYSRLLPGYGFPITLDTADKFAHVPDWMTRAYDKQIKFQLGVSLQNGAITDAEMRKILVQDMYMTKRDWLFRPKG